MPTFPAQMHVMRIEVFGRFRRGQLFAALSATDRGDVGKTAVHVSFGLRSKRW